MVFAGRSHPDLAGAIAEQLGVELGDVELETFKNGETYCRYEESIRGADVFLVQTGCIPVDENLMELMLMIQAAKLASAKRITAVMPALPVRAPGPQGEAARADLGAARRRHAPARRRRPRADDGPARRPDPGLLHDPGRPHDGAAALRAPLPRPRPTGPEIVSVAPDEGRAKMAVRFAEMIEAEFAIMHKTRPAHDQVEVTEITGRVRDKIAIVGDDVIMTGGTLIANVQALREKGVKGVWVFATHGVFCGGALEKFHDAPIDGIVVTDTVPINPLEMPPNMTVLPVAQLLAETIMNVFADDSVSAIFGGENQLF